MKTYEETREAIRTAIDKYSTNTHAIAQMFLDVLTRDITCSQFDKFFEYLMDKVLHYHDHKHFEDIIEKAGFSVKTIPSYENRETSPNSDNINKERYKSSPQDKEAVYNENLNTIGQAVSDATDYVYDNDYTEKEYALLLSDLANAIYSGIPPALAIDLAKELIALNDDNLDIDDISELIKTMDYNHEYVTTMSVAIRDYISRTSQADMSSTLGYIARIVSSCTNIENFSMFYAIVQKELMERLNKGGENTDVF